MEMKILSYGDGLNEIGEIILTDIEEVITDAEILRRGWVSRQGFIFTGITHPANIYDAIVIKDPQNVRCFSPVIKESSHNLEEQIELINREKIEKAMIIAENIDFIKKCPTLKYLRIIPAENAGDGFDYSPLYEMPEIKSIQCPTVYGAGERFFTELDCERLTRLQDIHVTSCGYRNYEKISTLKSLGLSGYKKQDLTEAFSSPILDTLTIIQCKIKSLEGIQKSSRIQCLYLYYDKYLEDISALQKIKKSIKALRIENCPKIKDFSILGELDHLELLELSGSNELQDLSFLKTMKSLKTFVFNMNVKDGDLSLCTGLSYVYSERNRKHYNLKNAELPKGQYVRGNEDIEVWRRCE